MVDGLLSIKLLDMQNRVSLYILLAAIKVSGGRLTCKLTPCSSRKSMQMIYVTNLCY